MTNARRCERCGATVPPGRSSCARCLLELARPTADTPRAAEASTRPRRGVPPTPAELAADFPQLQIAELIGEGGMGCVYRARHRQLDRDVALKILAPGSENDTHFAERFLREARALAKLDHPGIVRVYDFGRAGTRWYLLMEFVEGTNLRSLLRAGRLPPPDALAIVPQLCDALQYAHTAGVVHRDIKPENVLIEASGRVKLADFGLAKLLDTEAGARSATDAVMGTLNYMSPEQISRPREVDHRADIYSLGVVFYEMLTGDLPLGRFEAPSKRVQVDVRVDEVVLKSLERSPERRYQHAVDVRTDLERPDNPAPEPRGPAGAGARAPDRARAWRLAMWLAGSAALCALYWLAAYRFGWSGMVVHGAAQALLAFACLRRDLSASSAERLFARAALFAVALGCGYGAWSMRSVARWEETTSVRFAPGRFASSNDFVHDETRRAVDVAYGSKPMTLSELGSVTPSEGNEIDRVNDTGWACFAWLSWLLAGAALTARSGKSRWGATALAALTTLGVSWISSALVSDGYRVRAPDEAPRKPNMAACMSRNGRAGTLQIVREWIAEQELATVYESEWDVRIDMYNPADPNPTHRARLIVASEPSRFERWRFDLLAGPRPRIFPKLEFALMCIHSSGATTVAWRTAHLKDGERQAALERALAELRSRLTK